MAAEMGFRNSHGSHDNPGGVAYRLISHLFLMHLKREKRKRQRLALLLKV